MSVNCQAVFNSLFLFVATFAENFKAKCYATNNIL
jgi:hypothetical protein